MKLLFDQNISFRMPKLVQEIFPDAKHISDFKLLNKSDLEIWRFAKKEGFGIVTFDADFYDLVLINGYPPKIIWLRTGNQTTKNLVSVLTRWHSQIEDFLSSDEMDTIGCLEIIEN